MTGLAISRFVRPLGLLSAAFAMLAVAPVQAAQPSVVVTQTRVVAPAPTAHQVFQRIDRNDDLRISRGEFRAAAVQRFRQIDRDDNGVIGPREWRRR